MEEIKYDWYDRKRTIFGFPWSFTKYMFNQDKLVVKTGLLSTKEEEIRLYRMMDVTLNRSLGERMFGLGTIVINSSDKTTPVFEIKRIKRSEEVKNMLSEYVEKARKKNRVSAREFMVGDDMDDADDDIL